MSLSNLSYNLQMNWEALRSLAFGSIGASYSAIGTATANASRIFLLNNLTDVTLLFSLDGSNDTWRLPANGFILIDGGSNQEVLPARTTFYVKQDGAAPTSGSVNVSTSYAAAR